MARGASSQVRRVPVHSLAFFLVAASLAAPAFGQGGPVKEDRRGPVYDAIRTALPRVVKIIGASGIRNVQGTASGTIVSPRGHIVTLDGVLLKTENLRVILSDGRTLKAKLLRRDRERSMALLKIEAKERLPYFPPVDHGTPRVGQWVLSVANPFDIAQGEEPSSVSLGIVSAITRLDLRLGVHDFPYSGNVIVTDANNNPGGFGGALVDLEGRLLGINGRIVESKDTNTQISYAVPLGDLKPLISGSILLDEGEAKTPAPGRHGIRLFDLGTRRSPPAYVDAVERDSPAARAGLRKGDLIIRCKQTTVRTCKEFREVMARLGPGEEVPVTFKRKEQILDVVIRLEEEEP